MGRVQIKPAMECLRGVATYPQGDMKQGRYGMIPNRSDDEGDVNYHYANAVREEMDTLILGRANKEVAIGDMVELLLSISFACKDAMLEWKWLGIDTQEVATAEIGLGDVPN